MPCARPGCRNSDWNAVPEPPGRNRSTRRSPFFNVVDLVNGLGCPLLAQMRSADRVRKCLLFGVDRT
jgi:hypothetical protein